MTPNKEKEKSKTVEEHFFVYVTDFIGRYLSKHVFECSVAGLGMYACVCEGVSGCV